MNSSTPSPNNRSLVITGGCGFIGLNLLHNLASKGRFRRYVIVDNLSVGTVADLESVLGELGSWKAEGPKPPPESEDSRKYTLEPPGQQDGETCTAELHYHDIRTREGLKEIVAGSSAVVHLAAQTGVIPSMEDPAFDMEQNVAGTLNLLGYRPIYDLNKGLLKTWEWFLARRENFQP